MACCAARVLVHACRRAVAPTFGSFRGGAAANLPRRSHATTAPPKATISSSAAALREWLRIWKQQQDVFTLADVNEHLIEFLPRLVTVPTPSSTKHSEAPSVFLPLCGRSADMVWLAKQGISVVGLDAIAEPLRLWANDHGGLDPIGDAEEMSAYRSRWYPNLNLLHGDVFDLKLAEHLGGVPFDAVWDRGGVTSIDTALRSAYFTTLQSVLKPGGKLLLEFLTSNVTELQGTMTAEDASRELCALGFEVQVVHDVDVRDQYPSFKHPGLLYLREVVLLATHP